MTTSFKLLYSQASLEAAIVVSIKPWLVRVLLPVIVGGIIYLLFRSDTIIAVELIRSFLIPENNVSQYQSVAADIADGLPEWVIYSLPDGLWAYSLFSSGLLLWPNNSQRRTVWFIVSLVATLGSELLQSTSLLPGVLCFYDLSFYFAAMALYLLKDKVTTFTVKKVIFKAVLVPLVAVLFCFTSLASMAGGGEIETIVTVGQIASCAGSLLKLMNEIGNATQKTTATVTASYAILKTDVVKYPKFTYSDPEARKAIEKMERRLATMRERASLLHDAMFNTGNGAEQYYQLLETRANQNQNESYKLSSLQSIKVSKSQFYQKIRLANIAMASLDKSIQHYDDILNVIQIHVGLTTIQTQIGEVDLIVAQADSLNKEVRAAIEEGKEIILNDNPIE